MPASPTNHADETAGRGAMARTRLAETVLTHLLDGGSPEASLRSLATAAGVSHSLLLYHFGSTGGLLAAVHIACEQRERDHLAALQVRSARPVTVMRAMWKHLADPQIWPVYRLGFALRLRADVFTGELDDDREAWVASLRPLMAALELTPARARDEALLWIATCRGLLLELVTGTEPRAVHRAADRFFARYQ